MKAYLLLFVHVASNEKGTKCNYDHHPKFMRTPVLHALLNIYFERKQSIYFGRKELQHQTDQDTLPEFIHSLMKGLNCIT
jgi:hypothetical protein